MSGEGRTARPADVAAREPALVRRKRERERDDAGPSTRYGSMVMPTQAQPNKCRSAEAQSPSRSLVARESSPSCSPSPAEAHRARCLRLSFAVPPMPQPVLPFLLAHLSLEQSSFPPATVTPAVPVRPWSFPLPPPPPPPTYRLLHPFHHNQAQATLTPKRASVGPHPHLAARTKKRKLFHRFFRSESLLAGPSALHSCVGQPSSKASVPDPGKKLPTWWPSVSRSMGEGRESRLGPAECEWVGEGDNWLSRLHYRFGGGPSTAQADSKDAVPAERDAAPANALAGTVVSRTRSGGVPRGSRPRSVSSPPVFTQIGHHHHHHSPSGGGVPGSPPLKQHLLAVLRMRLSEGGSSSRGGEAGLRFKK